MLRICFFLTIFGIWCANDVIGDCFKPCPRDYDTVCDANGREYGNGCIFEVAQCLGIAPTGPPTKRPCSKGCPIGCPRILDPVCDAYGIQYGNKCEFEIAQCLLMAPPGRPTSPPCIRKDLKNCFKPCPKLYDPVCDANGRQYSNECEFEEAQCLLFAPPGPPTKPPCSPRN